MAELTDLGLAYFPMEHACRQMESLGLLDGMAEAEANALGMDSLGEMSRVAVKHGMLPVVVFLPYERAMAAYENDEAIQTMLS